MQLQLPKRLSATQTLIVVGVVVSLLALGVAWAVPMLFPSEVDLSTTGGTEVGSAGSIKVNFPVEIFDDLRLKALTPASNGVSDGPMGRANPFEALPEFKVKAPENSPSRGFFFNQ